MMRKGFTLVEFLVVIIIIPFAAMAINTLFKNLIVDLPKSARVVQVQTTVLNALEQMRADVDIATALPETFGDYTSDASHLLIEQTDSMVCYELEPDSIVRHVFNRADSDSTPELRKWKTPGASIQWRVWQADGHRYAVELCSSVRHKLRKKIQEKMSNAHVYFLGATGKARQQL